jgi:DnaJ domain
MRFSFLRAVVALVPTRGGAHSLAAMAERFNYRPKFVDIRVRKPPEPKADPDIKLCEHPGCLQPATCRAPKSRERANEIWWFCETHAGLYNANWDFFSGMTETDWETFKAAEAHGHRPTWTFRASKDSREARTFRTAATGADWGDPHTAFRGRRGGTGRASPERPEARTPAPVRKALEELGLEDGAEPVQIRRTYAELVRRFHPDSNGGDRSAEARLGAVVKAYKVLKTARRA